MSALPPRASIQAMIAPPASSETITGDVASLVIDEARTRTPSAGHFTPAPAGHAASSSSGNASRRTRASLSCFPYLSIIGGPPLPLMEAGTGSVPARPMRSGGSYSLNTAGLLADLTEHRNSVVASWVLCALLRERCISADTARILPELLKKRFISPISLGLLSMQSAEIVFGAVPPRLILKPFPSTGPPQSLKSISYIAMYLL